MKHPLRSFASLVLVCAGAWMAAWTTPAQADIWGYVDERGVAHFASEPLDARYQLFLRSAPVAALVAPSHPNAVVAQPAPPVALAEPVALAPMESLSPRLKAFFEQSPAVMRAEPLLREAAQRFAIDVELLKALVLAESGFDPQAVSPKGAIGLMQLMPATAQRYGVQGDGRESLASRLADPQLNVAIGSRHLRELLNRYPGRIDLALAAYNAGEGAVQRAGDAIPAITETRNYVRNVMQVYEAMRPPRRSPSAVASNSAAVPETAATASAPAPAASPAGGTTGGATGGATGSAIGGALGRRNMPPPLGTGLLPAVAVDAALN